MKLFFAESVQSLKGVGAAKAKSLANLKIHTIYDVLTHYPRCYEDRSTVKSVVELQPDHVETVSGILANLSESMPRRGMHLLKGMLNDGTGILNLVWFNQPFLKKNLQCGKKITVTGKISFAYGKVSMQNPDYEALENELVDKPKILPIYSLADPLNQKFMRGLVKQILAATEKVAEILPEVILERYGLMSRVEAMQSIHFPTSMDEMQEARNRLAFEELYLIQCGLLVLKKQARDHRLGIRHLCNGKLMQAVWSRIPFKLTHDQDHVLKEIVNDMEREIPMQRLLQGDVGSGKTVIAAIALVKTIENGYQGALMAPTEILAEQHYQTLSGLLEDCGIKVTLLSGKLTKKKREKVLEDIADGEFDLVIGTHALIQKDVQFKNLGLVVTDEQHRFGVGQRAALQEKGTSIPDVLVMTATPIPRTMTLTVYGDLDISTIKELPPGRKPIRTFVRTPERKELIYQFVLKEISLGRQAYIVCPLIEMSEVLSSQSAEELYEELSHGIFHNVTCGIVHGKLGAKEKERVMEEFYDGKIKVLVATTVIEVGVNVPNASIMVIESAERFGLAQLHQLRGRIGRGEYQSYCILISQSNSETAKERLSIMEKTNNGFVLAEEDLKLRGPGQFFGARQHGLPDLKIADILGDIDILLKARSAALDTLADPKLLEGICKTLALQYKDHFSGITNY